MYKKSICVLLFFIFAMNCVKLSTAAEVDTQRIDYVIGQKRYLDALAKLKQQLSKADYDRIMTADNIWLKDTMNKQASFFISNYPFYDITRAYAVVLASRGNMAFYINESNAEKLNDTIVAYESNKISNSLLKYWMDTFENIAMENSGLDSALMNDTFLFCVYDNYDTMRETASFIAQGLSEAGVLPKTGVGLSLGSTFDRETLDCTFRGNVKQYSANYFYTSAFTGTKFAKRDKLSQIAENEKANGLSFASNTVKSKLDYIAIRLDVESNNTLNNELYVYQFDRSTKQVFLIDTNQFLEEIAIQYKFE